MKRCACSKCRTDCKKKVQFGDAPLLSVALMTSMVRFVQALSRIVTVAAATAALCMAATFLSGCGAAYHRDKYWKKHFNQAPGYEGYVKAQLGGWVTAYYDDLKTATAEDQKKADRNRVINGYLLLADTAYSKFAGGYNEQIAYFEVAADLVNLGLTAAAAVTPPAALLGAVATGTQGLQHSIEKNGLNSQTRFVIINRMGAIRDRQRAVILQRELEPVTCPAALTSGTGSATVVSDVCYTLEDAMRDVNEYFYLGSINRALADIDSSTQQINQPQQGNQTQAQGQMAFVSLSTATFKVNVAASPFTVKVTGAPTPSIKTDQLPSGLQFDDNGNGTATLSGTPAPGTEGDHTINITAHNGVGPDVKQAFILTVSH